MAEECAPPTPPATPGISLWMYPLRWLKDASFWREVTARALAALLAGAIAYFFALATGYIHGPQTRIIAFGLICIILLFGELIPLAMIQVERREALIEVRPVDTARIDKLKAVAWAFLLTLGILVVLADMTNAWNWFFHLSAVTGSKQR